MKSADRPKFGNLQSLKVLNAGAVIAAPFVCELFAEQGADVIELESVMAPDMYRMYGDAWSVDRRNQRMMTLNIPSPEGKEILLQMVKWADVLVESSKGGTWAKWGLTDEVLWEANPALVILHISGFGNWGDPDYVRKASFDPIGQAFSGYSNLNGFPGCPPNVTKPFTGDFATALMGAWATLAAVIRARETGEGESIDCTQFESLVRIQGATLSDGYNSQGTIVKETPIPALYEALDQAIVEEMAFKADTIADLAKQCGLDEKVLVETVDSYNAMCDAGEDTEFGKAPEFLKKLVTGPFYAIKIHQATFGTIGALEVDKDWTEIELDVLSAKPL